MSKKMKLALLALLGFSTACSTVKNGAKNPEESSTEFVEPAIRVLYGVRAPQPVAAEDIPEAEQPAATESAQPETPEK